MQNLEIFSVFGPECYFMSYVIALLFIRDVFQFYIYSSVNFKN